MWSTGGFDRDVDVDDDRRWKRSRLGKCRLMKLCSILSLSYFLNVYSLFSMLNMYIRIHEVFHLP